MRKMIRKILVIRFRRIGDSVLSTALCRSLKENFPESEVHFVINEGIAPLYYGHPDIDKVIPFSEKDCHGWRYLKRVWRVVHDTHYDVIVDMRSTPKTLWFSLFSLGTKYRIGRRKGYNALIHNCRVSDQPGDDRVQSNLRLIEPLSAAKGGKMVKNGQFRLSVTPDEVAAYRRYMEGHGIDFARPIILCAVTARVPHKVWPYDKMSRVLKRVVERFDAQLVFNYAGDVETAAARTIWENMGRDKRVFLDIEAKGLRELCALAANSSFFFGNEGGPRHISQAFGVPSFAIYPPDISKHFWLPGDDPRYRGISPDDYLPLAQQAGMDYEARFALIPEEDVWMQLCAMLETYLC